MIRASGSNHEHDQQGRLVFIRDTPHGVGSRPLSPKGSTATVEGRPRPDNPLAALRGKDLASPVFLEDSLVPERGRPNQAERTSAILTTGWITHVVHRGKPLICPLG